MTRNYESNGPDVKIRGSAQQIAEKYATLARDAQSSGDRVMAENYLQHAEHYNRIIAAAQASMPIQNFQQNRDDFDDEDGEERDEAEVQGNGEGGQGNEQQQNGGSGPQPVIEGVPAEVALNSENGGRENFRNRRDRDGNRHNNGPRNGDYQRRDNQRRDEQVQPEVAAAPQDDTQDALPAFITEATAPVIAAEPEAAAPRKSRRPRRGEAPREAAAVEAEAAPQEATVEPVEN